MISPSIINVEKLSNFIHLCLCMQDLIIYYIISDKRKIYNIHMGALFVLALKWHCYILALKWF